MRKRRNRKLIPVFWILGIVLVIGLFSCIFALIYAANSNIMPRVSINNINVSGMSKLEAEEKFEEILDSISEEEMILKHGDHEVSFTLKRMELEADITDKVYEACTIGRREGIIANNYKIINVLLNGENVELEYKFNEEIVQSIFGTLDAEWEENFVDNSYYIDGDKLVIVRGKSGAIIDKDALKNKIIEVIKCKIQGEKIKEIDIPVIQKNPSAIDVEKIQTEIHKKPKDASYDKEKAKLSVHSDGVDFGVSIEEAKNIVSEEKEEYIIPLKITKPNITTEMLGEEAFPDVLGSFSTRYDASNKNRGRNIELAAEAINGKVLIPGEKFSFNGTVGNTTPAKGYLLAGAYSAGELVQNYGGGVCQVSSTIYNAVLYANLEIVERYNHSAVVSYVDPGLDATISYGSRDFKFKNSREYAIKINAKATNGILEVEIKGIAEDNEVEIELVGETKEVIMCNTKYIYDSSLQPGQEIVQTRRSQWS